MGGLGSVFQPDYAGGYAAPNRTYGVAAYADMRFTRWVQVEAEGRWLPFNEYLGIKQDNYLIGPRASPFSALAAPLHTLKCFSGWAMATSWITQPR